MITCTECGKPITTDEFWYRYCYSKKEYYCEKCAYSHIDNRGYSFGLRLTCKKEQEAIKNE